ncbi:hypothetical protein [Antarctobacter jejuensis]|uniref:hypothetical protein n=1 Tax=Antarctobacter jejuensis TaxID=1439938 RepID=UPI003FD32868
MTAHAFLYWPNDEEIVKGWRLVDRGPGGKWLWARYAYNVLVVLSFTVLLTTLALWGLRAGGVSNPTLERWLPFLALFAGFVMMRFGVIIDERLRASGPHDWEDTRATAILSENGLAFQSRYSLREVGWRLVDEIVTQGDITVLRIADEALVLPHRQLSLAGDLQDVLGDIDVWWRTALRQDEGET